MAWTTLTGAGSIVEREGELLMVLQRRAYGVHWELPSGYYEPGESYEQCAAREVREETGIDVVVSDLVCTMVWEREHDRRRNILAFFRATPLDPAQEPRPQVEENIEEARYLVPDTFSALPLHPLERPVLERLWSGESTPFHVHVEVTVADDGTQSYRFRGRP